MPADLNRVTLVGRLTRDPDVKQTAGGSTITTLRLAVTSRGKNGDQWEDTPNYFDVVCFGRTAETAGSYLAKGRRVGVDGRLQWREWDGKDGSKRQAVEVVANDVFFLDSRGDDNPTPAPRGASVPTRVDDSDIPFAPSVA